MAKKTGKPKASTKNERPVENVNVEAQADIERWAEEMLRCVLPVKSVDLLTDAVICLINEKEKKAAEKVIEHFFALPVERKAFMRLVNAKIEKRCPGALTATIPGDKAHYDEREPVVIRKDIKIGERRRHSDGKA
jgi:hypothetical protein